MSSLLLLASLRPLNMTQNALKLVNFSARLSGVVPYLINRFESYERRSPVLLAYLRFSDAVLSSEEVEEVKKFAKARSAYATKFAGGLLQCSLIGGGPKGVLGEILSYV